MPRQNTVTAEILALTGHATVADLADECGISRATIYALLTGQTPSYRTCVMLRLALRRNWRKASPGLRRLLSTYRPAPRLAPVKFRDPGKVGAQ